MLIETNWDVVENFGSHQVIQLSDSQRWHVVHVLNSTDVEIIMSFDELFDAIDRAKSEAYNWE
jgi:hypothetical protein